MKIKPRFECEINTEYYKNREKTKAEKALKKAKELELLHKKKAVRLNNKTIILL